MRGRFPASGRATEILGDLAHAISIILSSSGQRPAGSGQRLENFVRVETFGDNQGNDNNDVRWLEVTVDPRSRDVFSYQPVTVPANRTAVPAPTRY